MPDLMILFITLYRSTWLTNDYKEATLSPSLLHLKLSSPFSSYNLFIVESFLFKTSSFIDIILSFYLFNLIVIFDWINKETSTKCLYHHLWIKNETKKTTSMAQCVCVCVCVCTYIPYGLYRSESSYCCQVFEQLRTHWLCAILSYYIFSYSIKFKVSDVMSVLAFKVEHILENFEYISWIINH